MELEMRD